MRTLLVGMVMAVASQAVAQSGTITRGDYKIRFDGPISATHYGVAIIKASWHANIASGADLEAWWGIDDQWSGRQQQISEGMNPGDHYIAAIGVSYFGMGSLEHVTIGAGIANNAGTDYSFSTEHTYVKPTLNSLGVTNVVAETVGFPNNPGHSISGTVYYEYADEGIGGGIELNVLDSELNDIVLSPGFVQLNPYTLGRASFTVILGPDEWDSEYNIIVIMRDGNGVLLKDDAAVQVPVLTCDWDSDGDVDGADWLVWQQNEGEDGHLGDGDLDGDCDGDDFLEMMLQWTN